RCGGRHGGARARGGALGVGCSGAPSWRTGRAAPGGRSARGRSCPSRRTRRRRCAPCGVRGRWLLGCRSRRLSVLFLCVRLVERLTLEVAERRSFDRAGLLRRAGSLERLRVDPCELGLELNLQVALPQDRQGSRHVVAEILQTRGVVELAGRELEPEVEQLLLRALDPHVQLLVGKLSQLSRLARHAQPPTRVMNLVLIGSLCCARSMASPPSPPLTPPRH